ncbi:hypothetical protein ACGRL8_07370 [Vibrio rumoiensis]|uniref:Uncharacterized protein n=1 Tax=Vibrio rumoiensis TaxID=76258 RepID=A0ABW7IXU7_9VIBR|nr:hypothetical protein [Vibrio rumoiensis]
MTSNLLQDNNIILNRTVPHSLHLAETVTFMTAIMLNHWRMWRISLWQWVKK